MRRVIFVNRYFFPDHSATSQMLTDLAFHLAKRGWQVSVLTSRQRYDDPRADLPSEETVRGVEVHRVWTTRFGRPNLVLRSFDYATFYLSAFLALLRDARRGTVVVTKTDPPLISVVAAWACTIKHAVLVNWIQDLFPEAAERLGTLRPGPFTGIARWLRDGSLRGAKINVVIGRRMEEAVHQLGARTHLRENWADGAAIVPKSRHQNRLRVQWGLEPFFVVGYSGNLGRAHEFDTMLQAMDRLRDDESIRFVIIGAGPRLPSVRQFVEQRRLPNVLFKNYQSREDLADTLGLPDVHLISLDPAVEGLIVPSKFYGIAAAARPSIYVGDPEGEIAQLLAEHDCGIAVRSGDSKALVDAIHQLAGNRSRAEQMGMRARRLLEQRFDAPLALADWQQLLERIDQL